MTKLELIVRTYSQGVNAEPHTKTASLSNSKAYKNYIWGLNEQAEDGEIKLVLGKRLLLHFHYVFRLLAINTADADTAIITKTAATDRYGNSGTSDAVLELINGIDTGFIKGWLS